MFWKEKTVEESRAEFVLAALCGNVRKFFYLRLDLKQALSIIMVSFPNEHEEAPACGL